MANNMSGCFFLKHGVYSNYCTNRCNLLISWL